MAKLRVHAVRKLQHPRGVRLASTRAAASYLTNNINPNSAHQLKCKFDKNGTAEREREKQERQAKTYERERQRESSTESGGESSKENGREQFWDRQRKWQSEREIMSGCAIPRCQRRCFRNHTRDTPTDHASW
jgi:hypothetical protein